MNSDDKFAAFLANKGRTFINEMQRINSNPNTNTGNKRAANINTPQAVDVNHTQIVPQQVHTPGILKKFDTNGTEPQNESIKPPVVEKTKFNSISSGWIKLHRQIQQSEMYRDLNAVQRDVMIQCLLLANHNEAEWKWKGQIHKCQPGQFKTSLESIRQNCAKSTTIKMVRTALKKLEKWQFLANEGSKQGRIITIILTKLNFNQRAKRRTLDIQEGIC